MVRWEVIFESGDLVKVTTKTQAEAIEYAEALRQTQNWGEVIAIYGTPTKKPMIINERRQLVDTNL